MKRQNALGMGSKKSFLRRLAKAGLAGACFALASVHASVGHSQEPQSSRRAAALTSATRQTRTMQTSEAVPQESASDDAPEAASQDSQDFGAETLPGETPARLPPVQYEMLPIGPPPVPSDGPMDLPYLEDMRDVYGRPMNVGRHGLKYAMQDCYWGFPEFFEERPINLYNQRAISAMIGNGQGDFLVLYQYDFHDGNSGPTTQLNEAGLARFHRIVRMVKGQPRTSTVVVEAAPGQERVNRARQQEIAVLLRRMGVAEQSAAVSLGRPRRGLVGDEALPIYRNFVNLSASQGGAGMAAASDPSVNSNTVGTGGQGATGSQGQ